MSEAAIELHQKKEEAKFICSACGADRVCNCDAPAVEKLAAKMEQDRQRARKAREKKAEQKQQPRHVRNGNDVDNAQSAEKPAAKTKVPHALAEAAAKYGRDFAIGRAGALYTVPRSTSEPANTEPVTEDHVAELDEMSARDKGYAERRRKRAQQDIGDLVDGFDIDGFAQLLFDAVGQSKANAVIAALQKLLATEDGAAEPETITGNNVETDAPRQAQREAIGSAPPH
jgi:hypothetical protein